MSASKTYNGNDEWIFFTSTGKEIVLSEQEMQEMLDTLQAMGELENSTPDKIVELENRNSDLEDKLKDLENVTNNDKLEGILENIRELVEEV
jgi:DNA-binding transcriptional MerR regulator